MSNRNEERIRIYANDYDVDDTIEYRVTKGEPVIIPEGYSWELCPCQDTIKIVTENPDQFQKAHDYDGGYDILTDRDYIVPAWGKVMATTGLKVAIPKGYVGLIKSRSGLAARHDLEKGAGTIDYGYTGEIMVIIRNNSSKLYDISAGDKVAQMVIVPICQLPVQLVGSLDDSERAEKGFNSSGY
jgi:dUTP pyrophosphatase